MLGWKVAKLREVGMDEEWTREMTVGQGGSGSVSLAVASRDGFRFAVKSAPINTAAECDIHNEKALLLDLCGAPNVIRCLGWADTDQDQEGHPTCSIFLEYMRGGSVQDLIFTRGCLSEDNARVYTRAVVRALDYMHSHGVVHCDVKCANVLLETTREVKERVVRLADLGFGKRMSQELDGARSRNRGTWSHMAPELWELAANTGRPRTTANPQLPASDIWSLGCAVVSMLQGYPPWGSGCEAFTRQTSGARPLLPTNISPACHDFIVKCLQRDPSSRWTSHQLLHHPFLAPRPPYPRLNALLSALHLLRRSRPSHVDHPVACPLATTPSTMLGALRHRPLSTTPSSLLAQLCPRANALLICALYLCAIVCA